MTADKNPEYDTAPGNDTEDQVFLLSIPEVEKYFKTGEERRCEPTEYALLTGSGDFYGWWLRSPGWSGGCATVVDMSMSGQINGTYAPCNALLVRPALWVDLEP